MRFLLDSDIVIALVERNRKIIRQLRLHGRLDCGISAIAIYKLTYGACMNDRRAANEAHLAALPLPIVEFDGDDARQAGEIRAELTVAGTLIGPYDMLIAGQARARNLILVTHNTREFRRVSDLNFEDWEG